MKSRNWGLVASLFILTGVSPVVTAGDDAASLVERLPADTVLYLHWRGLAMTEEVRDTNPLLRLLYSQDSQDNWNKLKAYMEEVAELNALKAGRHAGDEDAAGEDNEPEWEEIRRFLGNEGIMAGLPLPADSRSAKRGDLELAGLIVFDTTSLEEKFDEVFSRRPDGAEVREYDFHGVTVKETKRQPPPPEMPSAEMPEEAFEAEPETEAKEPEPSFAYEARVGRWFLWSDYKETAEQFILSLQSPPVGALTSGASYQRAREYLGAGATFEMFLNFGGFIEAAAQKEQAPVDADRLIGALGLDKIEILAGSFTFAPDRARFDGALIMSEPVEVADALLGPPVADFPSLSLAPRDAVSFAAMQFDVGGLWRLLESAAMDLLPQEQAPMVMGLKGMAEGIMGMTIQDFASAWGAEQAQIGLLDGDSGKTRTVHAFGLRDRDGVVAALRNLLGGFGMSGMVAELPPAGEGDDTTRFAFLSRGANEGAETEPEVSMLAAFLPEWLLVSETQETIDQVRAARSAGDSLRGNPDFQRIRASMPKELVGLNFMDAGRLVETGAADQFMTEILKGIVSEIREDANEKARGEEGAESEEEQAAPVEIELPDPPQLSFPRGYVHWMYGYTSRDANGIYFSGTLE